MDSACGFCREWHCMAEANLAERFISYRQTSQRTNLSERSISRKVAVKEFPQPIPISPGRKAFIESEVDAWIEEQVALARKHPPPTAVPQLDARASNPSGALPGLTPQPPHRGAVRPGRPI
jgi:prophage regulatory protein